MINVPIFAAASPASFRDAILAAKPDPNTGQPDLEKLKAYAATHPDAKALTTLASHHTPTANYYQTTYFSVHTFKFIDARDSEHLPRRASTYDPILLFRSPAYAVSFAKRLSGQ